MVVYSGPKPWSATGAADAVPLSPDGTPLLPVVAPYRLLDSRRAAADDATERNPALAVLGVEGTTSPAQAAARMQAMAAWLPQVLTDRDVRREFGASVVAWLAATMPRLFRSADDEEIENIGLGLFEEDEMTTLHLRAKEWEAEWLRQGIAQGMEQGMERGLAQGMERGLAQGMERGLAQGVERGLAQGVERGLAQGVERGLAQERSLLREQAARKFGAAVGEELARRLESTSDAEALRDIGVLIIDCADGAELLARVPPTRRRLRLPSPTFTTFTTSSPVRRVPAVRPDHRQVSGANSLSGVVAHGLSGLIGTEQAPHDPDTSAGGDSPDEVRRDPRRPAGAAARARGGGPATGGCDGLDTKPSANSPRSRHDLLHVVGVISYVPRADLRFCTHTRGRYRASPWRPMPPGNACSHCPPWSSTCCAPSPPELAHRLDFTAMEQLAANWTRPTDGAEPHTGARPTDGAEPHTGARPTGGAEPHTGTRPTGGADLHTDTRPTDGADPHTGARPTGGTDPHTGTRPTGGAGPRPSTQRYADAVWRIRYAGADARTLVLLLEFQSTVDPDMAARTLAYTSLLREHLRRQGKFDPDGGLRTLAVVVYSGPKPWSAAGAADAVPLSPDGTPLLTVIAPYRLLDSRREATDDATERNPALAVLGVEGADSPAQAAARMQAMAAWLPQVLADRDVRREFGRLGGGVAGGDDAAAVFVRR